MSNAALINDTDHFAAKKRLAGNLRIIAIVQTVALCAVVLGLFLSGYVPNHPAWDAIHSLCGVLALSGMVVFVVVAFCGSMILIGNSLVSISIHRYALSIWGFFPFLCLFGFALMEKTGSPILSFTLFGVLFIIFPFYSIIPQFFIAGWLAKEADKGTMRADRDDSVPIE